MNKQHRPAAEVVAEDKARRRRRRRLIIAASTVAGLILFGFFGLPPIVRAQAVKRLSVQLKREVAIEKVRINPLVLSVTIEGLHIKDHDGGLLAGWQRLHVNLDTWGVFRRQLRFSEIALDGFEARVGIDKAGAFNFADLIPPPAAEPAPAAEPEKSKWSLYVGDLAVSQARVDFGDASRSRPFATTVGPLTFNLTRFHTAPSDGAPYGFTAQTESGERFEWAGTVSVAPVRSAGDFKLTGIKLPKYAPYYADRLRGDLRSGELGVTGSYELDLSGGGPRARLAKGEVRLTGFALTAAGEAENLLELDALSVTGIEASIPGPVAHIARVSLDGGRARIRRDADGINLLNALLPPAAADTAATPAPEPAPAAAASAGPATLPDIKLDEFSIAGFAVAVEDLTTPRPAYTDIDRIDLVVRELRAADLAHDLPFELKVALPEEGTLTVTGTAAAWPLKVAADLAVSRAPLSGLSPYVEPFLNVRIARGTVSTRGHAALADGAITFTGDASMDDFGTVDAKLAEDFVKWTSLAVNGIHATTAPLALGIKEVVWTAPSASVVINPDGTINLAEALAGAPGPAAPEAPVPADPAPAAAPMAITLDRFELRDAAFRYTDRSVRPAARTSLTGFGGTITGLSSAQLARADVDLRGKVDGTAPVAITGRLNPLGQPAFVDLTIDFKNIALPASAGPYIGKYAGYELARGNLSLDIKAGLQDRRVNSANVVVLDQFTLGAKTNSPDATRLPVSLAIALLKDVDGRIVIDLPVKGSLDDPQFKVGRVVLRVVTNILVKAATSPFSLLGAAFGGGGDELGYQDFAPGVTVLSDTEVAKLQTVAKALNARPALMLDLAGGYDIEADLAALRLRLLDLQIRSEVWEALRKKDPATPPPDQIVIPAEKRAEIVTRIYTQSFPPKEGEPGLVVTSSTGEVLVAPSAPRRFFGRLRHHVKKGDVAAVPTPGSEAPVDPNAPLVLTLEQMEARIAAKLPVSEDGLPSLADARAQAVRTWLVEQGRISGERVFLQPPAPGRARVQLNLR